MDKKEIIDRLGALKSEADALIAELNKPDSEPQSNVTETVLKKYIEAFGEGRSCYAIEGVSNDVIPTYGHYRPDVNNPFCRYLSEDYAKFAARAKRFVDACLVFKWCWDAEYNPDWYDSNELKWYIAYNHIDKRFEVYSRQLHQDIGTVYFSTRAIAERCADWLNTIEL